MNIKGSKEILEDIIKQSKNILEKTRLMKH